MTRLFVRIAPEGLALSAFLVFAASVSAETFRVYFDPATPQIGLAAGDIKAVRKKQRHTVQVRPLSTLEAAGSGRKIVLAVGAMDGGLDFAEAIRLGTLDTLKDSDHSPCVAQRGIKFNVPLDKRQPSCEDNGTSGQENFRHVWDLALWKDDLDLRAIDSPGLPGTIAGTSPGGHE